MAQILRKTLKDHTGGVSFSFSEELDLNAVLLVAQNARNVIYGTVEKRAQTKRVHETVLPGGGAVQSIDFWNGPEGRQVILFSGGDFFYKTEADPDFTRVGLGIDTSLRPNFVVHRFFGEPRVYFADGSFLYSFDGSTVRVVAGAPDLTYLRVYNTRLFGVNNDRFLYYSGIDNPEAWTVNEGAGQAAIETYDSEPLLALHVVGSSLLCFKENSISRFTGYDIRDIQIDTETSGVTSEVGTIAPHTVVRVEDVLFFLSDRGPYFATESAIRFIGLNIETVFETLTLDQLQNAYAAHNRLRREIWLAIPGADDPTNTQVWRYNYRMQAWWGPDDFVGYSPAALARYERDDGSESIVVGGYDGFVRDGDVLSDERLDDVLRDGTGGEPIPLELQYREVDYGTKEYLKIMYVPQTITADLGLDGQLVAEFQTDTQPKRVIDLSNRGPLGTQVYRFRPAVKGRSIFLTLREETKSPAVIQRVDLSAKLGRARWY